jgi:hypothetical protein
MRRSYTWGPVDLVVEAGDSDPSYRVILQAEGFRSTPTSVDAHEGAPGAARRVLGLFCLARRDAVGFVAEQRTEGRHLAPAAREAHAAWADAVAREAASLGDRLDEAGRAADERERPIDVSGAVGEYLGLLELGHDLALAGLGAEGRDAAAARELLARRAMQDIASKWRLAPGRRIPTAAPG